MSSFLDSTLYSVYYHVDPYVLVELVYKPSSQRVAMFQNWNSFLSTYNEFSQLVVVFLQLRDASDRLSGYLR